MNKAAWSPGSGELDFYGRRLAEPVGGASRNGRASVLHDLGRLEEAEAEHRAVLEIRRRVLGPEHPPRSSGCRSPISPPGFLLWVIVEFSPLR